MQILLYQEMRYIGPDLSQRSVVLDFARFHIQQQTTLASFLLTLKLKEYAVQSFIFCLGIMMC